MVIDPDQASRLTLLRTAIKTVILLAFSTIGLHRAGGFCHTFYVLALITTVCCIMIASVRQERFMGPALNSWDEAYAFLALATLSQWIARSGAA